MKNPKLSLLIFVCLRLLFSANSYAGGWATSMVGTPSEYAAFHQSMVIDGNGRLHVAFYHVQSQSLKYATNASGTWQAVAIDGRAQDISTAIDSKNNLYISYLINDTQEGEYSLRYATNMSGEWEIRTVDTVGATILGNHFSSIAVGSTDKAHIFYYAAPGKLKYATNSSGTWATSLVDSSNSTSTSGKITMDGSGVIHVVFGKRIDNFTIHLMHGKYVSKNLEIVDMGISSSNASIAIDSFDNLHIAYYSNGDIYYWNQKLDKSDTVKIDNQSSGAVIAVDTSGNIHVCYSRLDTTTYPAIAAGLNTIKYATNSTGTWVTETIDPYDGLPDRFVERNYRLGSSVWSGNAIAIDQDDSVHVTYDAWLDMTQNILRYATNRYPSYNLGRNRSRAGLRKVEIILDICLAPWESMAG